MFIIIIGMLISYIIVRQKGAAGQIMDMLIMFPFVIPGAVLGISLIVAFNKEPVILTGTAAIMIIAFVVRKLPYTVRSGSAFLQQMDPCVEEASINLGVSPMKTFFTLTARLMAPGILSGGILSWITCINELSSQRHALRRQDQHHLRGHLHRGSCETATELRPPWPPS